MKTMGSKTRSCHPPAPLILLCFLAVSSTAISYPVHHRDVHRRDVDTVEAPSILNTNSEQQPVAVDPDAPPRRYVRLDDVTESLRGTEDIVVPAYRQDSAATSADEDRVTPSSGTQRVGGLADAVRVAVEEISSWRERIGSKIWGLGEGEGNVIGGRQGDL